VSGFPLLTERICFPRPAALGAVTVLKDIAALNSRDLPKLLVLRFCFRSRVLTSAQFFSQSAYGGLPGRSYGSRYPEDGRLRYEHPLSHELSAPLLLSRDKNPLIPSRFLRAPRLRKHDSQRYQSCKQHGKIELPGQRLSNGQ
jgi:hypothetical protein